MSTFDIRGTIPYRIANKLESSTSGYVDVANIYDVALSGIPFNLKINKETPYRRSTAQFRKDQLDTSTEPGEQSLTGWWLRSQSSFHWGSGLKYGDPELDETATFRYTYSEGVNPWTAGQVSLLPATDQIADSAGSCRLVTSMYSGDDVYFRAQGDDVIRGTEDGTETTVHTGTGDNILSITTDGDDVYFADTDGIYKLPHGASPAGTEWNLSSADNVTLGWVKQRIVAGVDNKIYVPTFSTPTLPAAVYEHPNDAWIWTDIAEGPEAIYISGYVGNQSVIVRLALDAQGDVPTLTNATVVAEFPTGEVVLSMEGYLGTFLGIGTSKGVRIATFNSGGTLVAGPLVPTPSPVSSITAKESHFLASYSAGFQDGMSGLIRVDLSTQFPGGGFPYAPDLQSHEIGNVDSVSVFPISGKTVFGVADVGVFVQDDILEANGFLETAAQRYNTVWPKLFKRFNIRGDFTGPMSVSTVDDKGTETNVLSISSAMDQTSDFAINYPDSPQEFLSLKFTLNRSPDDDTVGTVFRSYQLKAIPGGPRPRQYTLPLACWDYEKDPRGQTTGYTGWADARLKAIEALDSSGDVVLYMDLKAGTAELCTIEAIEFTQTDNRGVADSRTGGILMVVLRTLAA